MSNVYIRRENYRKILKKEVDVQDWVNDAVKEKLDREIVPETGNGGEKE